MSIIMIFRIAIKALGRNKMRTALTMLGMIIGVAAVITMVALGTGAQTSIEAQIQSAGTNMIIVSAGNFSSGGVRQGQGNASTLVPDDAVAISRLPGVQYVAPGSNTRGQVIAGNQNWGTQIQGTDVDLPLIRSWPTSQGAFFTPQDVTTASKVAVLGATVRDQLFGPDVNTVGQVVRIQNQPFTVTGVMSSKGQSSVGQDQDDVVYVPYTTVMKKLKGVTFIQNVTVSAASAGEVTKVGRFHGPHDGRNGERPEGSHPDDDGPSGEHRRRVAARRRDRHHEHHAGLGDRAHSRNRIAHGNRGPRTRRPAAVSRRGGRAKPVRRNDRHRAGLRAVARRYLLDAVADRRLAERRRRGLRVRRGHRRLLRFLSRAESGRSGSH
jgi:MacB-like periplasmic core domain